MILDDNYNNTTLTTEVKSDLPTPVGRIVIMNRHKDIRHSIDLDKKKLIELRNEIDRIINEI